MNLLFPLYVAGFLAVSLPILFHLIRRMPKGQTDFSSLMFLKPSPPRLSKHSRLENILLLLLRALALILLALAFARPFLRQSALFNIQSTRGRHIALLVDTSASMKREGLWEQTIKKVDELVDKAKTNDSFALFTFDRDLKTRVALDSGPSLRQGDQRELVRKAIRGAEPTWNETNLAGALVMLADELHARQPGGEEDDVSQIVVVSDMQEGSHLAALNRYQWPSGVQVAIEPVKPSAPGNASLHLVTDRSVAPDGDNRLRIRVANSSLSPGQQFRLDWGSKGTSRDQDESISIHVLPGQSKVVRVPLPKDRELNNLVLHGDVQSFDNGLYVARNSAAEAPIGYWGADEAEDATQLHYFLKHALAATESLKFEIIEDSDEPISVVAQRPRFMVITRMMSEGEVASLRKYLEQGGAVLYVVQHSDNFEQMSRQVSQLCSRDPIQIQEAEVKDFALLGEIDFQHPLFAAMSDPRFNDFSKIHFWRHRELILPESSELKVVSKFDDGSPAIVQGQVGRGNVFLLTSGWHPADSQLALSTKFVPLLKGMVTRFGGLSEWDPQFDVSQSVRIPESRAAGSQWKVVRPEGTEILLEQNAASFDQADAPGIFGLTRDQESRQFAVNIAFGESKTDPMPLDQLEQHGVLLGWHLDSRAEMERRRQQRDVELEGKQRIWQWLIVTALGILLLETWLAGRLSLRRSTGQPDAQPALSES